MSINVVSCIIPGDIFAGDIVAHKNCMECYIKTYEDHVRQIVEEMDDDIGESDALIHAIDALCSKLDLKNQGYNLTAFRNDVDAKLV